MLKIAVTGASGFIGKRFIDLYQQEFLEVIALNSKNAPLNDYRALEKYLMDIDVVVHAAFDHYYQYNTIGLTNIIRACKMNKVKKIVFLSTVSVYNPDVKGELTESSSYTNYHDPYSMEKVKLEKMLEKVKEIDVIILQPTVVYGIGGNWSNYAIMACKKKNITATRTRKISL